MNSFAEACLKELDELASTAGAKVVGRVIQRRQSIRPSTFLSRGKLDQLKAEVEKTKANLVISDEDLSPAQVKNLEKYLEVKILDRSEVILDIFSRHARTREAMTQVELAQLEYLLPRLSGMWEHLSRLGGGIGTRGPGETQLEVDRRQVRRKISILKQHLEVIERERDTQTRRRKDCFRICLVGYTNAGKSTLFNAMTQSDVLVEDKLFATLETTTRRVWVAGGPVVLLSDTVGFIRKLPHHLVASFRATLREVIEADLLVQVVDASHADLEEHMRAVDTVLDEILPRQVIRLLVFNKTDLIDDEVREQSLRAHHTQAEFISAFRPEDVARCRERIGVEVRSLRSRALVTYPHAMRGALSHLLSRGQRVRQAYLETDVEEEIWLEPGDLEQLKQKGARIEMLDGAV